MVFESFFPTLVSYVCLVKRGYEYKIKIELSWEELQGRPWTIALGLAFLLPVPDSYHALLIKEHFVQLQNNKSLSSFWFCSSSHRFVCIVRRRRRIGYTDFWMFAKLSKHPKINFVTSRQLIFWRVNSRLLTLWTYNDQKTSELLKSELLTKIWSPLNNANKSMRWRTKPKGA